MTLSWGHEAPDVASLRRVLISGPRRWPDPLAVDRVVAELVSAYGTRLFVGFGDAVGVDAEARRACERLHVPHKEYEAKWDAMAELGKPRAAAGSLRNGEMLAEHRPDELRAFCFGRHPPKDARIRPWREVLGAGRIAIEGCSAFDLVETPLTRGTGDMVQRALAAGVPVGLHGPEGKLLCWLRPEGAATQAALF